MPELQALLTYNGANSYRFVSFDDDWEWHWNAGLVLSWNLWDGGRTGSIVDQEKLELAKSLTDLDELEKNILLSVERAHLDMLDAGRAVEAGSGNIELAERALEIAGARFTSGLPMGWSSRFCAGICVGDRNYILYGLRAG